MLTDEQLTRIENLVEAFRLDHGIQDDVCPDMLDLLVRMRIKGTIAEFNIRDTNNAIAGEYDAELNAIGVSREVAERQGRRDRFTVAHEIGHKLADHESRRFRRADGMAQHGAQVSRDEEEANAIASALLVPERLANVTEATTVSDLADRFAVSHGMAEIRLKALQRRYRLRRGIRRPLPIPQVPSPSKPDEFDGGDYDAAMSEMLKNAERWNR